MPPAASPIARAASLPTCSCRAIWSSPTTRRPCRRAFPVATRRAARRSRCALPAGARSRPMTCTPSLPSSSAPATFACAPRSGRCRRRFMRATRSRSARCGRRSFACSITRAWSSCASPATPTRSAPASPAMADRFNTRTSPRRSRCGTCGRASPPRRWPSRHRRRASSSTGSCSRACRPSIDGLRHRRGAAARRSRRRARHDSRARPRARGRATRCSRRRPRPGEQSPRRDDAAGDRRRARQRTHEPGSSHHALLRAFVADATLARVDAALESAGYRSHEFGDSVLIERAVQPRSNLKTATLASRFGNERTTLPA